MQREYFAGRIPFNEQWRPYFGRSLDLTRIEQAIIAANHGRMSYMTDLARETIMLDSHVSALLQKRLNRLGALKWQLTPAAGPGIDEGRAKARCEEVRENLAMIPGFADFLIDMAWGNFDGRAASEIEWFRWGRSYRARQLHWIHPRRLCFGPDRDVRVLDPMRQTGNFMDVGFPIEAVPCKFVVYKPRLFGDYQEREGLAPRTLYWSFFSRLGRREQLELMEIFGKPWRIMKPAINAPGGMVVGNIDTYNTAFQALTMLGFQNTARMPPGVDVQIVQPEQGAGQVHNDVIKDCRDVLTKLFVGGIASTEASNTGLGSNTAKVHADELDLIIASDARRIQQCVEDQLTDAIIIANYGPGEAVYAPTFVINTEAQTDKTEEGVRAKNALDIGLRIAEEELRERLGYRPVRDDEPYLVRFQRPATAGQVSPPPAPETVWPVGEAPTTGEVPDAPDVVLPLPKPGEDVAPGAVKRLPTDVPANDGDPAVGKPGDPAVPATPPPTPPKGSVGGGAPGNPGDPGHKDAPGGGAQGQLTATDEPLPDGDVAQLAAQMTALGLPSCEHGKINRCRICGIERVRTVELGDDNEPVWKVAWKPIGTTATKPPTLEDTMPEPPNGQGNDPDDDDIDSGTRVASLRAFALSMRLDSSGMAPNEGGNHWHHLSRSEHRTDVDGEHTHWFQLPDDTLIQTDRGGAHQHRWPESEDKYEHQYAYGGQHLHGIAVEGATLTTQVDGAHGHELQTTATTQSGQHRHCLVLADGATIESLSSAELADILESRAMGEPITYSMRRARRLAGIVPEAELARPRQLSAQTSTVYGSPDDIVERGTAELARLALEFGQTIAQRVDGKTTPKAILKAINAAQRAWKASRFADGLAGELEHGMWLGALDAHYEGETGKAVQVETFSDLWRELVLLKKSDPGVDVDPAFSKRPQIDAGKAFIEKDVVTRDIFDEMTKSAQRRAFTVANAATDEIARAVKRELVRQVAVGADLADFKKNALARLESAGWTPQNASHAETVLRTNVMTAYNSGRYRQMTQPSVVAALPYWQVLGVGDDRQRETHHEAMNRVLPADDDWFKTAYPPFGYRCRCRVRSLTKSMAEKIGISSASDMPDLPDKGFASGAGHLM